MKDVLFGKSVFITLSCIIGERIFQLGSSFFSLLGKSDSWTTFTIFENISGYILFWI